MTGKRVLITGGAGFVGSHLADALLARGCEVRILDNLAGQVHPQGRPAYLSPEVELLHGDARDPAAVRDALRRVDAVYHLAAAVGVGQSMYEIEHYVSVNIQGTATLLQALLETGCRVEKLVVASSMSIYGEGQYLCPACGPVTPPPRAAEQLRRRYWEPACPRCGGGVTSAPTAEAKPAQCPSIYALSKKSQEEMALLFGRTYAVPVVALRYFNIYGPRQALSNPYTGVAAIFASRLLNHRPPQAFEDGRQVRDFVSVHDVVQASVLALERKQADGRALNVGSGESISIADVALALARALGSDIEPEVTGKYRAGDIRHCYADISAAEHLLGYDPRVRFADGIAELVEWLRSQSAQDRAAEAVRELDVHGLVA